MKATLRQLIEAVGVTQRIGDRDIGTPGPFIKLKLDLDLGVSVRFRIMQILRQITAHLTDYNERLVELYTKHGTQNEETKTWDFGDNVNALNADGAELGETEVEITGNPISITNLEPVIPITKQQPKNGPQPDEDYRLNAEDMLTLYWLWAETYEEESQPVTELSRKKPKRLAAGA